MSTIELRKKWIKSIVNVDDTFLQMIDALYQTYTQEEQGLFEDLPVEIQEILIKSQKNIEEGNYFLHEEVMEKVKQKFNF